MRCGVGSRPGRKWPEPSATTLPLEPTDTTRPPASPGSFLPALRRAWSRRARRGRSRSGCALWLAVVGNLALWRELTASDPAPRRRVRLAWASSSCSCRGGGADAAHRLGPLDEAALDRDPARAAGVAQHFMLTYGVVMDPAMLANNVADRRQRGARPAELGLLANMLLVAPAGPAGSCLAGGAHAAGGRRCWRNVVLLGAIAVLAVAATARCTACWRRWCATTWTCATCRIRSPGSRSAVRVACRPLSEAAKPLVPITAGTALGRQPRRGRPSRRCWCWWWARPRARITSRSTAIARDTTPELAARGVLSFRDVWSCGTNTLDSVPCMFSPLGKAAFEAAQRRTTRTCSTCCRRPAWRCSGSTTRPAARSVCARVPSASTADLAGTPARGAPLRRRRMPRRGAARGPRRAHRGAARGAPPQGRASW